MINIMTSLLNLSITTITSIICIILLILITMWLSYRDTIVKSYVDKRLQTLKEELNKLNNSQFSYDKDQESKLNNIDSNIDFIKNNYIPRSDLEKELKANIVTAKNINSQLVNASTINVGPQVNNSSCQSL